ncbi:C-terminal helicase domain-containing protein, partial [Streptomyces lydicus]
SQPQRTRTLEQFRTGQAEALIATNVAARGIHIDGLDLVVNVDPPTEAKDYLHRGGRTARAGESGTVVTLVTPGERREMTRLMRQAKITPGTANVRPGDAELVRITGARTPSGVPVVLAAQAPSPASGTRSGAGGGGAGGGRRRPRRSRPARSGAGAPRA